MNIICFCYLQPIRFSVPLRMCNSWWTPNVNLNWICEPWISFKSWVCLIIGINTMNQNSVLVSDQLPDKNAYFLLVYKCFCGKSQYVFNFHKVKPMFSNYNNFLLIFNNYSGGAKWCKITGLIWHHRTSYRTEWKTTTPKQSKIKK